MQGVLLRFLMKQKGPRAPCPQAGVVWRIHESHQVVCDICSHKTLTISSVHKSEWGRTVAQAGIGQAGFEICIAAQKPETFRVPTAGRIASEAVIQGIGIGCDLTRRWLEQGLKS